MNSETPEDLKWRCLRAKPKSEHLAARHLKKAGFEVFCPRLRYRKKTVRGNVWYVEAVFPGYLFCKFSVRENLRQIATTAFVSQVMTFMHDAGAVKEQIVQNLQREFADVETEIVTVNVEMASGDEVDIVAGPLQGTQATVSRVLPGVERVRILLEFIGGLQEVEISLLDILGCRDARQESVFAK